MKILLLAPELFTTDSGIPRILRLYLKGLCAIAAQRGGQVSFVSLNDEMVDTTQLRAYADGTLAKWTVCSRRKGRFIRETLRLARSSDLIVCGHVAQLPVAWLARCLNRRLRYVLVAHGIEVWRSFNFIERRALRGAARVFCVSNYTRTEILNRTELTGEQLVVLPNALDPQLELRGAPVPIPATPDMLVVSRLTQGDQYKGVDHLIQAMPAVLKSEPGAKLRIVGRGDDQDRLYRLARDLNVLGAVVFVGFVSDEKLREEFDRCRLFTLPSEKEGFGLVYVEAMAHGRPCLGARSGGTPEVITPETGMLVPFGNPARLAQSVVVALHQNWNEAAILARARHFSYSQFEARLASLLPS